MNVRGSVGGRPGLAVAQTADASRLGPHTALARRRLEGARLPGMPTVALLELLRLGGRIANRCCDGGDEPMLTIGCVAWKYSSFVSWHCRAGDLAAGGQLIGHLRLVAARREKVHAAIIAWRMSLSVIRLSGRTGMTTMVENRFS